MEVSFNRYGERGRVDLLAWHPRTMTLLVIEVKTDLVDVQALLGAMDIKTRLAAHVAAQFGWQVGRVVPGIVFLEDRTTRRKRDEMAGLFDRCPLRGRVAISWMRQPAPAGAHQPPGILWFMKLPNARVVRIGGQRVRRSRRGASR